MFCAQTSDVYNGAAEVVVEVWAAARLAEMARRRAVERILIVGGKLVGW
jgi:hypothetical protein